jgi:AraC family transcriptional regulator
VDVQATTLFESEALSVHAYRCGAGPGDRPFTEVHERYSLSYVRRGSFGCRTLGAVHELVAGAVLVGRPGREYVATHEHHGGGDECLSVKLSPELAQSLAGESLWRLARVPPLPEIMVFGEQAQAAAEERSGVGVDEAALVFAGKCAAITGGRAARPRVSARARRRAIEAALWLEAHAADPVRLEDAARAAGLSPFHFLRVFAAVVGVTPHQHLMRLRLARAARLLCDRTMPVTEVALEAGFADLSNFVRTFRRVAGASPGEFRKNARDASRLVRNKLQERMALPA